MCTTERGRGKNNKHVIAVVEGAVRFFPVKGRCSLQWNEVIEAAEIENPEKLTKEGEASFNVRKFISRKCSQSLNDRRNYNLCKIYYDLANSYVCLVLGIVHSHFTNHIKHGA
jgi:hypothetical protein